MISLILAEDGQLSVRSIFMNDELLSRGAARLAEALKRLARQSIERAEPVLVSQPGEDGPIWARRPLTARWPCR